MASLMAALAGLLALASPSSAQKPTGTLVDVGGYRVHLYCTGQGSPTIVLIGGFSFDWSLVQTETAKNTRVCSYDPAGRAWSDPAPHPRCEDHVQEIGRMLSNARIEPPYVLVGLSIGALYARLYAKQNPHEVVGMVFVDHAFEPAKAQRVFSPTDVDSPPELISAVPIQFGAQDEPGYARLPKEARELHDWAMSRNPDLPTAEEAINCREAVANATLGSLPLAVVSTANDTRGYADLQRQLLALSSNSRQLIAEHSFHSIEISQPEIVIRAIRMVTEAEKK